MDKANGELEKGAEGAGASGVLIPTVRYRGVLIPRSLVRDFEEPVWKRAVDLSLEEFPYIDRFGRLRGDRIIHNVPRFLRVAACSIDAERLGIDKSNYSDLALDASERKIDWKTHLQAAIDESARLGITVDAYIESLKISYVDRLVKLGLQDLLSPNELSKLKPSDTHADLHRS